MRGNKFPNFHFLLWSPWIQILFKYKTLERRWHDFFHLFKWQGVLKIFEFHLKIFPILKLYATQWFSWEKIKWLLQIIWNMSWEFQRIKFKALLNLFSIWNVIYEIIMHILFSCILVDPRNFTQLKDLRRELEISLFSYLRVFSKLKRGSFDLFISSSIIFPISKKWERE